MKELEKQVSDLEMSPIEIEERLLKLYDGVDVPVARLVRLHLSGKSIKEAAEVVGMSYGGALKVMKRESVQKIMSYERLLIYARLRVDESAIKREISAIATSNILDFVEFEMAKEVAGYDENGDPVYSDKNKLTIKPSAEIPRELAGAIKSIKETKMGLQIELHDKVSLLSRIADDLKIFEAKKNRNRELDRIAREGEDIVDMLSDYVSTT